MTLPTSISFFPALFLCLFACCCGHLDLHQAWSLGALLLFIFGLLIIEIIFIWTFIPSGNWLYNIIDTAYSSLARLASYNGFPSPYLFLLRKCSIPQRMLARWSGTFSFFYLSPITQPECSLSLYSRFFIFSYKKSAIFLL